MRITVLDSCPARSEGIIAALKAAGFSADATDDLASAVEGRQPGAAIVSVDNLNTLECVRQVCTHRPDVTILALLPVATPSACLMALQAGASAIAPQDATLQHIVTAVFGALEGYTVLPSAVARSLIQGSMSCGGAPSFTVRELKLLHRLAAGTTITTLAKEFAYSERSIYRLLGSLYRRLGVSNRSAALIAAARYGLIEPQTDRTGTEAIH